MKKQPSANDLQRKCHEFNSRIKVGDPVIYRSLQTDALEDGFKTKTRGKA